MLAIKGDYVITVNTNGFFTPEPDFVRAMSGCNVPVLNVLFVCISDLTVILYLLISYISIF